MNKVIEPTSDQLLFSSLCPTLVLCSTSPNRKKLLECGGSSVSVFSPLTDEKTDGLTTEDAMKKNAREKIECYLNSKEFDPSQVAISADTLVEIDGLLLGKPKDKDDAFLTLSMLSGKVQKVYTGCAIFIPKSGLSIFCDSALVKFHSLSKKEIEDYIETNEWVGAAGGYRIQKSGYTLVESITGDFSTVVGLPLKKLIQIIQEARRSAPSQAVKSS